MNPKRGYITNLQKLHDILGNRTYEQLDMKMDISDGESHTCMYSPAFRRGLKWIFGKKSIDFYTIALEVDPGIPSAIEALKHLEAESYR